MENYNNLNINIPVVGKEVVVEREMPAASAEKESGRGRGRTRLLRGREPRPLSAASAASIDPDLEYLSDCSFVSGSSTATSVSARKRLLPTGEGEMPHTKSSRQRSPDEDFLTPYVPVLRTRTKDALPSVAELGKEMAEQPTGDLGSRIAECLETVEKVADRSRNLKGCFVRSLRLAARNIQAATTEMVQRATPSHLESENALLRSQLTGLNKEVEALRAELNELRNKSLPRRMEPARSQAKSGEDSLMDRIGSMIDQKFAAFRAEIFPDRAIRPPLGQKAKPITATRPKSATRPVPTTQAPPAAEPAWVTVVGRKAKAKERRAAAETTKSKPAREGRVAEASKRQPDKQGAAKKAKKKRRRKLPRVPKSAAVSVTVPEGSQASYAQVMQAAKAKIRLSDLGIAEVKQKRAINGGLLLQVAGEECAGKADALAAKLHEAVADLGVKVARPTKHGEARVMDLDESVTQQDVASAIANACGCAAGDVKVGEIRRSLSTLGTVWVRCPLTAIRKLAEAKRVLVGWVSARVDVLPARALQCYRCLEKGHSRHQCTSPTDRSALCYACGEPGHTANQCVAQTKKCALCAERGLPADHRLGAKCPPQKRKARGGVGSGVATATDPPRATGLAPPSASSHCPPTETMDI